MAYNLPPAWDPGFVLPENVHDEGLERRALVTRQMPRGTYDNPRVGTGGFAVPQYVRDEGYGQGTFTTKWQPSGTYNGPRIPFWLNQRPKVVREQRMPGGGRVVTVQALGDDAPMPIVFDQYGQKAARALLARVATLPPGKRETALRAIMDKVDKSLWARTQTITKRYMAQGMPLAQAFPEALARALSTGIAAEIIDTGLRRVAPQAKSLLGLGCYRHALGALGLVAMDESGGGGAPRPTRPPTTTKPPTQSTGTPPPAAPPSSTPAPSPAPDTLALNCAPPAGFKWVVATADVPGHWQRLRAGEAPGMAPCASNGQPIVPQVRDQRGDTVAISPTEGFETPFHFRADLPAGTKRNFAGAADITVFPDTYPEEKIRALMMNVGNVRVMRARNLPQAWIDWIRNDQITPGEWKNRSNDIRPYSRDNPNFWYDSVLKIPLGTKLYSNDHSLPQAYVKWPVDGSETGLYYMIEPLDRLRDQQNIGKDVDRGNDPDNPLVLKIWVSKWPEQSLWSGIVRFFAKIVDVVGDALEDLADLACDLISTPGVGEAAGAAGAAAAGVPPQAGAQAGHVGAQIAQNACGTPPPPVIPPPVVQSSILPLAILGGVAVIGAFLLTGKKKSP